MSQFIQSEDEFFSDDTIGTIPALKVSSFKNPTRKPSILSEQQRNDSDSSIVEPNNTFMAPMASSGGNTYRANCTPLPIRQQLTYSAPVQLDYKLAPRQLNDESYSELANDREGLEFESSEAAEFKSAFYGLVQCLQQTGVYTDDQQVITKLEHFKTSYECFRHVKIHSLVQFHEDPQAISHPTDHPHANEDKNSKALERVQALYNIESLINQADKTRKQNMSQASNSRGTNESNLIVLQEYQRQYRVQASIAFSGMPNISQPLDEYMSSHSHRVLLKTVQELNNKLHALSDGVSNQVTQLAHVSNQASDRMSEFNREFSAREAKLSTLLGAATTKLSAKVAALKMNPGEPNQLIQKTRLDVAVLDLFAPFTVAMVPNNNHVLTLMYSVLVLLLGSIHAKNPAQANSLNNKVMHFINTLASMDEFPFFTQVVAAPDGVATLNTVIENLKTVFGMPVAHRRIVANISQNKSTLQTPDSFNP